MLKATHLDQSGRSRNLSVEMLLALFLLHFERKSGTKNALKRRVGREDDERESKSWRSMKILGQNSR